MTLQTTLFSLKYFYKQIYLYVFNLINIFFILSASITQKHNKDMVNFVDIFSEKNVIEI